MREYHKLLPLRICRSERRASCTRVAAHSGTSAHLRNLVVARYEHLMSTSRRSRMQRTRTGKRLMLTERDLTIFRWLSRYRYLRSTYLHAFAGGASETRLKERLGDLFHESYLDRPEEQWRFADCRHTPAIYELGRGGRQALGNAEFSGDERRVLLGQGAHRQFAHSLMICEVLASIELAALGMPNLRFVPLPEILAKAPEATRTATFPLRIPLGPGDGGHVVPDALFGLEYVSGARFSYRFFALEADRGTMPVNRIDSRQTSLAGKIIAYRQVLMRRLHRSHLGLPNLLVLLATASPARLDNIASVLGQAGGEAAFLFTDTTPQSLVRPCPGLLTAPWHRAGVSALRIDNTA